VSTKTAPAKKATIKVAVVESDPLRFIGFRSLFDNEKDLELISWSWQAAPTLTLSCWEAATARTYLT
jgi:hypothetical protein